MHVVSKGKLMVFVPITLIVTFLIQLVYIAYITAHMLSNTAIYGKTLDSLKEETFQAHQTHKSEINEILSEYKLMQIRVNDLETEIRKIHKKDQTEKIQRIQHGS